MTLSLLVLVFAMASPARAATLLVTTDADSGAGSLREAIATADSGDTISFAPALNGSSIVLISGGLVIRTHLNILGPGPTHLAINGNGSGSYPVFVIPSGVTGLLAGLTITNGYTGGTGGGLAAFPGSLLTISNCVFRGNWAQNGGGIYNHFGSLTILNCAFDGNSAVEGGAIYNFGGSIFPQGGTVTVKNSEFNGNSASWRGGGIVTLTYSSLTVQSCTLKGNQATDSGGGIHGESATIKIENSTLSHNSAARGGGVWTYFGSLVAGNSTFSGNAARSRGGGFHSELSSYGFQNCTFTGNWAATNGGAFYMTNRAGLLLNNCIVAGNYKGVNGSIPSEIEAFFGSGASGAYNLIGDFNTRGGFIHGVDGNIVGENGSGTIDMFNVLDLNLALNGGPTPTHALIEGSPAINSGLDSGAVGLEFDQRGSGFPRIVGGTIDRGAYEFQGATPPRITCPGNILTNVVNGTETISVNWPPPDVIGDPPLAVTCVPPSGSAFAFGTTIVNCTANNLAGFMRCSFTVTVRALYIPVTTSADGSPGSLRAAIASALPGGTIIFAPALNGSSIVLTGELPIDKNLNIIGLSPTNLSVNGNGTSRVFIIRPGVRCLLADLTITNGNSGLSSGGGIWNYGVLILSNCVIAGNSARSGGGVYNSGGTVVVQYSTVMGNSAGLFDGGGLENSSHAGVGPGRMTVLNSTLSDNRAWNGGGIANHSGILTLLNCTLSGNRAIYSGGGILAESTEQLTNTIVAGNFVGTMPADVAFPVEKASHNLIGDFGTAGGIVHGVNGNIVGNHGVGTLAVSRILDTNLALNGGSTPTHALVSGSLALNAGLNDGAAGLTYDQRGPGFPRLVGGRVDLGALEMQPILMPVERFPSGLLLRAYGATNEPLQIIWSDMSDPAEWSILTNGTTDSTGMLLQTLPVAADPPRRFYRAVRP